MAFTLRRKILRKVLLFLLGIIAAILLTALLLIKLYPSFGGAPDRARQAEYAERSAQYKDGKFSNPGDAKLFTGKGGSGEGVQTKPPGEVPVIKRSSLATAKYDELRVMWFGHSTALIQMHGMNILIDPVLSKRATPLSPFGPERAADAPMTGEDLPFINLLLISHDHYDHLDYQTIRDIDSKVAAYCVPLGVECHLEKWGVDPEKICVFSWWDEIDIDGLRVTATPGQHFSGRLPWRQNGTLWCGYALTDEYHSVYYSGDTGYGEFFKEIGAKFGGFDLALMECGQYNTAWANIHSKPENALRAAEDIQAKWVIPVHWCGFTMSVHPWDEPAEALTELAEKSDVSVAVPMIGQLVSFDEISACDAPWWREVK